MPVYHDPGKAGTRQSELIPGSIFSTWNASFHCYLGYFHDNDHDCDVYLYTEAIDVPGMENFGTPTVPDSMLMNCGDWCISKLAMHDELIATKNPKPFQSCEKIIKGFDPENIALNMRYSCLGPNKRALTAPGNANKRKKNA